MLGVGMFVKRIGPDPHASGGHCSDTAGCPDIWELDNGDFAVIGSDITYEAASQLPPSAGCAPHERIIRLPRQLVINAKRHIPE